MLCGERGAPWQGLPTVALRGLFPYSDFSLSDWLTRSQPRLPQLMGGALGSVKKVSGCDVVEGIISECTRVDTIGLEGGRRGLFHCASLWGSSPPLTLWHEMMFSPGKYVSAEWALMVGGSG